MKLSIKNMVCNRCVTAVRLLLKELKMPAGVVTIGEAILLKNATAAQLKQLNVRLKQIGFELLDNQKHQQVEKIKNLLIEKVQSGEIEEHFSISDCLSKALHKEYNYLSRLFSAVGSVTIEQFFILQKIEKVKEWLVYDELTDVFPTQGDVERTVSA